MNISQITPQYLIDNGINPEGMIFGPYHLPYNSRLKGFSRNLRTLGVKSEAMLWKYLKTKQIGFAFNRQKPILNHIADFYCKEVALVVEIDGASHFSAEAWHRDQERNRQMRVLGLTIVRVLDSDVRKDAERVAKHIEEKCREIRAQKKSRYC